MLNLSLDNLSRIFSSSKRRSQPITTVPQQEPELGISIVTDQQLVEKYCHELLGQNVRAIATDRYLDKSRRHYNEPWLVREIVQNFVDHNHGARGTLNGVLIKEDEVRGIPRFTITGNWPFEDITGVISPHSEKPTGNTAGGNGIGLKQAAIRLIRDFGVQNFTIIGDGWSVKYSIIKASQINLTSRLQKVKHDWLIGEIIASPHTNQCQYIIETSNSKLANALREFYDVGVSEQNQYLTNPDYSNSEGTIKWNTKDPENTRFFMNGQAMNYLRIPRDNRSWAGITGVNLRLNNVDYDMTVDRPPVENWDLKHYIRRFVRSMSTRDLINQFRLSEPLWRLHDREEEKVFVSDYHILLEEMADQLQNRGPLAYAQYASFFHGNKYVHYDPTLSLQQNIELKMKGYVICPGYFRKLGIPSAANVLTSEDKASGRKPKINSIDNIKRAEESGIVVGGEDFSYIETETDFLRMMAKRLAPFANQEAPPQYKGNSIRIFLNTHISSELLFYSLHKPKNNSQDQKLVYLIRGIALHGISNNIIHNIFTGQREYVTTFATNQMSYVEPELHIRNTKLQNKGPDYIEIELSNSAINTFQKELSAALGRELPQTAIIKHPNKVISPATQPRRPKTPNTKVIERNIAPSPQQEHIINGLQGNMNTLRHTLKTLEQLIPEPITVGDSSSINQYRAWRESGDFYGMAGAQTNYLTGKHIQEIVIDYEHATIATVHNTRQLSSEEQEIERAKSTLKKILHQLTPDDEEIQDFEIVSAPSQPQLAQLALLRSYIHIVTGVAVPNDLFIYNGTGSKGININRKAIGLHASLLNVSFLESIGVFVHEIAHNEIMDHDTEFARVLAALLTAAINKLHIISAKQAIDTPLDPEESTILDIQNVWHSLQITQH